jgi:hypothetical protein
VNLLHQGEEPHLSSQLFSLLIFPISSGALLPLRGSTSDKHFTVFLIMGGVAGFLGTLRWQAVGDATALEATLAQLGFICLLIVAMFEVDVSSLVFLEEKLVITSWLLEKLKIDKYLNFKPSQYSPELLDLIRSSPELHHLYEEDVLSETNEKLVLKPIFLNFNFSMHMLGAGGFVIFITASLILNDLHEAQVAWITGSSFIAFASVGYLTGSYVPVFSIFKGWILLWNPFVREPDFLIKLQEVRTWFCLPTLCSTPELYATSSSPCFIPSSLQAVNSYNKKKAINEKQKHTSQPTHSKKKKSKSSTQHQHPPTSSSSHMVLSSTQIQSNAKKLFASNPLIGLAHQFPKPYLRALSHVIMTIELIALLTPMIAMGIQWITSLCDSTPPVIALLSMFYNIVQCVLTSEYDCRALEESCILAKTM